MVVVANEPCSEAYPILGNSPADRDQEQTTTGTRDSNQRLVPSTLPANLPEKPSPQTAFDLLNKGTLIHDKNLVTRSIENLDQFLNKDNVLLIYSSLSKCKTHEYDNYKPSAPPAHEDDQRTTEWLQGMIASLRHNCLLVIDKNADHVLKKSEISGMTYEDLMAVLERDSLRVSDETLVYSVVLRWAIAMCMKKGLVASEENLRLVSRDLCYSPRYGLMSKKQFLSKTIDGNKGPTRSGILNEEEWRLVKFYIEERSKNRPVQALPHKFSTPRSVGFGKPRVLSPRSSACLTRDESLKLALGFWPRCQMKKKEYIYIVLGRERFFPFSEYYDLRHDLIV